MVYKTIDKNVVRTIIVIVIMTFGIYIIVNVPLSTMKEEKRLFPGIIGDAILKNNETGIYFVRGIASYDDFRGNITQGYKANYTGRNGTMTIFIVDTPSNESANVSVKEMAIRLGYDPNIDYVNNTNKSNWTIVKLPINNPEVYAVRRDKNYTWHYTFAKFNKVYWVGFSKQDTEYQASMLIEVYRNVAEKVAVDI